MNFRVGNGVSKKETPLINGNYLSTGEKWQRPENGHIDTKSLQGEDREKFILSYMGKVEIIARKIVTGLPPQIRLEDLIHEGVFGLLDAMKTYDPNKEPFNTFSEKRIIGAILDSLRKNNFFKRNKEIVESGGEIKSLNSNNPAYKNIPDNKKSAEEFAYEEEQKRILKSLFEEYLSGLRLEETRKLYREFYRLYYEEEKSFKEVCEYLHIDEPHARNIIWAIRKRVENLSKNKGLRKSDIDVVYN